jgi:hypothetical protein
MSWHSRSIPQSCLERELCTFVTGNQVESLLPDRKSRQSLQGEAKICNESESLRTQAIGVTIDSMGAYNQWARSEREK